MKVIPITAPPPPPKRGLNLWLVWLVSLVDVDILWLGWGWIEVLLEPCKTVSVLQLTQTRNESVSSLSWFWNGCKFLCPHPERSMGTSSNQIVCLFVIPSRLQITLVQYLKFEWWYSHQTWTVSLSKGCSHITMINDIPCPWGWGRRSKCTCYC